MMGARTVRSRSGIDQVAGQKSGREKLCDFIYVGNSYGLRWNVFARCTATLSLLQ